jgi:hypothetical protein
MNRQEKPAGGGASAAGSEQHSRANSSAAIRYSRGRDKFDAHPEQRVAASFDEFEAAVLADTAVRKGLQYVCAPMRKNGDGRTHRGKDDALPRRWASFDIDRIAPDAFHELMQWFHRFRGFAYTTASHNATAPRVRVILEASREMTRSEGERVGLALQAQAQAALQGATIGFDASVYRAEQPCYCPPIGAQTYRFEGEPVDVDAVLREAPPAADESPGRRARLDEAAAKDAVLAELNRRGMVKSERPDGAYNIECPCAQDHTGASGETTTIYYLPHTGGFTSPKFKCLHDHCVSRPQEEFWTALGLVPPWAYGASSEGAAGAKNDAAGEGKGEQGEGTASGAAGKSWPEPEPLTARIDPEPYPVDALPGKVGAAVLEVQAFVQAPLPLVACSALSALSVAVQAQIDIKRADRLFGPVSLFLLAIADSGERKTTVDGFFTAAIREWEAEEAQIAEPARQRHCADLAAWKAKREALLELIKRDAKKGSATSAREAELRELEAEKPEPPRVPRLLLGDETPEHLARTLAKDWPSGGVISSEAGVVFGAHGMNHDSIMRNLALLNVLWDGREHSVGRNTSDSFTMRGARLTVGLQVQEATLREFFKQSKGLARGSGFLARFLTAWPTSTQGHRPFREAPPRWPALAAFNERLTALLEAEVPIDEAGVLQPQSLELAPDARAAWVAFHDEVEVMLRDGGELADVKDVASKAADNAARLAALFHVFEGGAGPVGLSAFNSASRIVAWHLNEGRRFFGELALPAELADAARLDEWLLAYCRRDRVTSVPVSAIQKSGPGRLREKAKLEPVLRELADLGRVRQIRDGKAKTIDINPALLSEVGAP